MIPGIKTSSTDVAFVVPIPCGLSYTSVTTNKTDVTAVDTQTGTSYSTTIDSLHANNRGPAHAIVFMALASNTIPNHIIRFNAATAPTITFS